MLTKYVFAPVVMYGGAAFTAYVAVVLIHTFASGVPSVGLTLTLNEARLELYARPFVVRNASVVTYPGPFIASQDVEAQQKVAISPADREPSPFPRVESICNRRSRRFAGPRPGSVLSGFKVTLRQIVRLLQSFAPYPTVVWYSSGGAAWSTRSFGFVVGSVTEAL